MFWRHDKIVKIENFGRSGFFVSLGDECVGGVLNEEAEIKCNISFGADDDNTR